MLAVPKRKIADHYSSKVSRTGGENVAGTEVSIHDRVKADVLTRTESGGHRRTVHCTFLGVQHAAAHLCVKGDEQYSRALPVSHFLLPRRQPAVARHWVP